MPAQDRFYRLYLMKEQNTEFDACLYVGGDDHNFIHVILNNDSQLKVTADSTFYAPFGNYTVEGNTENHLMRELSRMVYPSFYFYQIRFPTELFIKLSTVKTHINKIYTKLNVKNRKEAIAAANEQL